MNDNNKPNTATKDDGNINAVNIPTNIRYVAIVPKLLSFAYTPTPMKPNNAPQKILPRISRYGPTATFNIPSVVKLPKSNPISTAKHMNCSMPLI